MNDVTQVLAEARQTIALATSLQDLEAERIRLLGKKGVLTGLLKGLGSLPASERPRAGAVINSAKIEITEALETRREALRDAEMERAIASEKLDVTLPSRGQTMGGLHQIGRAHV